VHSFSPQATIVSYVYEDTQTSGKPYCTANEWHIWLQKTQSADEIAEKIVSIRNLYW